MAKIEDMLTTAQVADEVESTPGALRVLAHRGKFIAPDLQISGVNFYRPAKVRAWNAERERRKRRATK